MRNLRILVLCSSIFLSAYELAWAANLVINPSPTAKLIVP